MHQLKQAVDNHARTVAATGQSWDTSRLALPEGAHIPQPSSRGSSKLGGGPCVPQGHVGRHGHTHTPCLCWRVQTPTKTREGHWASGWLAARHRPPCFSSPCSCPSGSHSLSVSWNNTEINEMHYHFYHCYTFGFTSRVNVKWAFKMFYSKWRVITMNGLRIIES